MSARSGLPWSTGLSAEHQDSGSVCGVNWTLVGECIFLGGLAEGVLIAEDCSNGAGASSFSAETTASGAIRRRRAGPAVEQPGFALRLKVSTWPVMRLGGWPIDATTTAGAASLD